MASLTCWNQEDQRLANYWVRKLDAWLLSVFRERIQPNASPVRLLEMGAGNSKSLPYFAKRFGFMVTGVDYSAAGCDQARAILKANEVSGELCCADFLSKPELTCDCFDVLLSFGVLEHFTDPAAVLEAFSKYLKPGGLLLTEIPNMRGSIGWIQKHLAREIYDIHVPHTLVSLREAHQDAGLEVLACHYLIGTSFGVINAGLPERGRVACLMAKIPLALLSRLSMLVWWLESRTGWELPRSELLSPYLVCVAVKPGRESRAEGTEHVRVGPGRRD